MQLILSITTTGDVYLACKGPQMNVQLKLIISFHLCVPRRVELQPNKHVFSKDIQQNVNDCCNVCNKAITPSAASTEHVREIIFKAGGNK